MGLCISVGYLADMLQNDEEGAEYFESTNAAVNRLLGAQGLPPHVEPRTAPTMASRSSMAGFPYSTLHYLRRAYAHRAGDANWIATPLPDGVDPTDDPVVEEQGEMFDSHLLCHSDSEGWYVPIDFEEVIFATDEDAIPGEMLGSTQRLRAELALAAPALGIALAPDGELPDAEAARLDAIDTSHPMWRELMAWLALWEAARISLASGCAVVFS